MYRFVVKAFLVLSVLAAGAGCRTAPPYNVINQPIVASGGKAKSLDDVKAAIVGAGRNLGWNMRDVEPGHLEGTLRLRSHVAVVDVKYSTTNYSITYKDSQDLKFDGATIHSNYNSWIQNLQREIERRL